MPRPSPEKVVLVELKPDASAVLSSVLRVTPESSRRPLERPSKRYVVL